MDRAALPFRAVRLGVVVTASVLLAACLAPPEKYRRQVRDRQDQAYERWESARKDPDHETLIRGKLGLQDAISLGLRFNKQLLGTLETLDAAKGSALEAHSGFLPNVAAQGSYVHLKKATEFRVGGQAIKVGARDNYSVELSVFQPVFRGGGSVARLRAAWLSTLISDEAIRGAVQQTIFSIASEYYGVLLARELTLANREAVKSAEAQLEEVRQKRAQGLSTDYDVLRAEVDLSNFTAAMIQQRNRIRIGMSRLYKAMGVSQASEAELTDPLEHDPMVPELEEAVRIAYRNRPDLNIAQLQAMAQEQAVLLAQSLYLPQIDGFYTYTYSRPDPFGEVDEWGDTWQVGGLARWFVFDGLAREGRVMREKALLRERGFGVQETEERAHLEVQQAIVNLQDADEFVESQRRNLGRANEALRLVTVGYREGLRAQIDVVDARSALTQARSLYHEALHAHALARLQLQSAMGILGPWAGEPSYTTEPPEEVGGYGPFMRTDDGEDGDGGEGGDDGE